MRTFKTVRTHDVSGVSGTGVVAEGVELTGGKVVLHWLTDKSSITVFESIQDLIDIHGHEGSTTVRWEDEDSGEDLRYSPEDDGSE